MAASRGFRSERSTLRVGIQAKARNGPVLVHISVCREEACWGRGSADQAELLSRTRRAEERGCHDSIHPLKSIAISRCRLALMRQTRSWSSLQPDLVCMG